MKIRNVFNVTGPFYKVSETNSTIWKNQHSFNIIIRRQYDYEKV